MKYIVKYKDNKNYDLAEEITILDCLVTLLNHFEQGKNYNNMYIIDLCGFNSYEIIIIKSIIEQIKKISPEHMLYIIGENTFTCSNVQTIQSISDVVYCTGGEI